jgi:hypothetical protein
MIKQKSQTFFESASTYTGRREVVIMAVLADGGGGGDGQEPVRKTAKKLDFLYFYLVLCA